nr:MAG TPA: large terminase [Caudoviricetes sp.]
MPISDKQKKILAFSYSRYDSLICDGAVRSGKTSIIMWAFVDWAMRTFNGERFGICGKTVDSCTKNIIVPFTSMSLAKERYTMRWRRADKVLEIRRNSVTNYFEVFGGKDESSYALIQGRTLAGVLLDEVVLMPRSFVEQALTRCSVDGAKLWFSCNPDNPQHWFYTEWICKAHEHNALHLHFEMTDNPGLSKKTLERYQTMFTGVFYDRYIRGLWVAAEGLIYEFGEQQITDDIPDCGEYYISVDYGTLNPFSAGLWCIADGKAVRIAEYYYSGRDKKAQKTDEEYCDEIIKLAGDKPIKHIIVDPSAASFITALRRRGAFSVRDAKNDVLDGIRITGRMLKNGQILIHRSCKDSIREFGLYRWDDDATADKPIKENDHAMDEIRYFANTVLRRRFKIDRQEN